ncbi:MAG: hypothetical protein OEZ34_02215 [Spirochaetia bacterium]|nr:hypothetical protein [Spirochaetia bacterium]
MSEENSEQLNAAEALLAGDMTLAKELYGSLLEKNPETKDCLCGFYTASYWENRMDILHPQKEGREAASLIMKEWDQFEAVAEEKKFAGCRSLVSSMRFILGVSAANLRFAYQMQGASGDTDLLLELSHCLIRIENFSDAIEILQYARKFNKENPKILFALGEAFLSTEDPEMREKGISFYRDAFFIEPSAFEISHVYSLPVGDVLKELYENFGEDIKKACEWLPSYLLSDYFIPELRCMGTGEIEQAVSEVRRLVKDLGRVADEFKNRVRSRVAFYSIVLIHYFTFCEQDVSLVREYEQILAEMDSRLHERFLRQKRG